MTSQTATEGDQSSNQPPVELEIDSWVDLVEQLMGAVSRWVFRGQGDYGWNLTSRLARVLQQAEVPGDEWESREQSLIGFFKDRSRLHLPTVPSETDLLGWLSLMQHYRAPTRLMDWTASPFVGVFFALSDPASESGDAALWALNAYYCRRQHVGSLPSFPYDHLGIREHSTTDQKGETKIRIPALEDDRRMKENDLIRHVIKSKSRWPLPVLPFDVEGRMTAQQAAFTCIGDMSSPLDELMDQDRWPQFSPAPGGALVGTDSTVDPLEHAGQLIKKVRIRSAWRQEGLEALRKMGITHGSLFPGLDGIGDESRFMVESGLLPLRDVLTGLF